MDRFNKLPFAQKIGALVMVLGLIGGLFYYSIITTVDESIVASTKKQKTIEDELAKLQKDAQAVQPDELVKRKQQLEAEALGFVELLPKTEELVKFISGLSETAKGSGLELLSFEKGKPSERNFYTQIPINMNVKGTYRQLVGFLRSVADADRRVVNVRNLKITADTPDVATIMQRYMRQRADALPKGYTLRGITEQQIQLDRLNAYDEVVAAGLDLTATFTAYVFLYTGKELSEEAKALLKAEAASKQLKLKEHRLIPL